MKTQLYVTVSFFLLSTNAAYAQVCQGSLLCNNTTFDYLYTNNGSGVAVIGNNAGTGAGVRGASTSSGTGVVGVSSSGIGVSGTSTSGSGVSGTSTSGNGVTGTSTSSGVSGVFGQNNNCNGFAVAARNMSTCGQTGAAIFADTVLGGQPAAYAGYFNGFVYIHDDLLVGGDKFFLMDHPSHPDTKYLKHASIESSEVKNLYDGVAVTDASGNASVALPSWFEDLNTSFRYQLTPIGAFASLYISQEIQNGQFKISGGLPNMKVSWQVTGIRQDAYAKAHPMQVEMDKPQGEIGRYLHPELFGVSDKALMPALSSIAPTSAIH